jgi:CBS domain-containing protein
MPIVNEIMSTEVQMIAPEATLREAAQMMLEQDVGALPVCQGATLLPEVAQVAEVMTKSLEFCTEDQDTEDVMQTMGHAQVRRLPVVNLAGELVGIVSIADMARRQPGPVDQAVRDISEPTPPDGA